MSPVFCFDDYELDCDALELRYAGAPLHVDAKVLRVLEALVRSPGTVVSKEELLATVWGGRAVSDNSLTVAMTRLRKALDEHGSRDCVVTVHGKGYRFAHPVALREPGAPAVSTPPLRHSPLAGREQVMQQLGRALSELKSGHGGLVALRGEPGIGKTRVAEVFAEQAARAGCAVSWAFCRELSDPPAFWPFIELLRSLVRKASAGANEGPSVAPLLPELSRLLPEFNPDHQLPSLESRYQVYDLVARTLACVAEVTPQVLILDDVHCADTASLDLLYYLLAGVSRMRVLTLVTLCHVPRGERSASRITAVLTHRNCLRIGLAPLSKAAVLSLVAARGIRDPALSQKLYSLSEGNPYYLSELLRALRDDRNLDSLGLTVPPGVFELVRRRLSRMDPESFELLTFAAVIGKTFGLPLLAAATDRAPAALMPSLDSACTSEIIRCVGQSGTQFEFTHNLLRSVLYEQQTPGARRARHLRVVDALERRRALAELACSEIADHAMAALPDGDLRKTVELCVQAASHAEEQGAFSSAIRYLVCARESLELLGSDDLHLRFQLLFRHALLVRAHCSQDFLPLAEELLRLGSEQSAAALAAASLLLDPSLGLTGTDHVEAAVGLSGRAGLLRSAAEAKLELKLCRP